MSHFSDRRRTHLALDILGEAESPELPSGRPQQQETLIDIDRTSSSDIVENLKRKRTAYSTREDFNDRTAPVVLELPRAVRASVRAHEYVTTRYESPWKTFRKIYELKFKDFVTIATRMHSPHELVTVKLFEKPTDGGLDMLQRLRHENFVMFLESFQFNECSYSVFEHIPISLVQIVTSPPYPTELQLAAIVGQILNGLAYLHSKGYLHGSLACSNILLRDNGVVKITDQEHCRESDAAESRSIDLRAVGRITMELMQKYCKEDGIIGVENLERWPIDSKAVNFLSETTSASSIHELITHPLITSPWRSEELGWLVDLATVSVHRAYKYTT